MKQEEVTDKAIEYILDGLSHEDRMSIWETSFVESVTDQWNRTHRLSGRQKEVLGNIWDKY